jgi:hypothetical protein
MAKRQKNVGTSKTDIGFRKINALSLNCFCHFKKMIIAMQNLIID